MNKNDILARLQKGESPEDIAKEMSDMLNEASQAYEDQKKKDNEKWDYAMAVANAINDYAVYAGYKGVELKPDDVIKVMDSFFKFYKDPENFKIEVPGFKFEKRTNKTEGAPKRLKTVDEILNDWISRI